MKLSKRLLTVAEMIDTESIVDVGCDHALLDIYLTLEKNKKCRAVDISPKVLKKADENINKYSLSNKIQLILSNGLNNIPIKKNDTIVITGMGTSTILEILKDFSKDNKIILCSNNEHEKLRKNMIRKNYVIIDEKIVFDKNHWYVIIKFEKGHKKYKKIDYILGPIAKKNSKYLKYRYKKNQEILSKIPKKYFIKKLKINYIQSKIKKLINSF